MEILLVLTRYLPEKNAGIENYCHHLSKLLNQSGQRVNVAILESTKMTRYTYEEISIIPLEKGLSSFSTLVQENTYDICHFQEYSGEKGIHIGWFKIAKLYCKKVFFTFHLPYLTCYKNDFRHYGIEDCSTFTSVERCLKCIVATKLNYQNPSSYNAQHSIIQGLTPLLLKTGILNNLKHRIQKRQDDLGELLSICNKVFLIANWFKELLIYNGYTSSSLVCIPAITKRNFYSRTNISIKKKILFIGRIEYQKGLLLLCKAMKMLSINDLELDVFGDKVDKVYFTTCLNQYQFNYGGTLPHPELLKLLPDYDFLILPSLFTEMYPLVIQEAFGAELPVIASAAKGNIDVISEGKNGFVFDYDDDKELARVIDKAYSLKQNGWQPEFETMDFSENNANEILSYYQIDSKL